MVGCGMEHAFTTKYMKNNLMAVKVDDRLGGRGVKTMDDLAHIESVNVMKFTSFV